MESQVIAISSHICMTASIFVNPSQTVSLVVETTNSSGERADGYLDGYAAPVVTTLWLPSGSTSSSFPQTMTQLGTGLYYLNVTIPSGSSGVGSFIADIHWNQPGTGLNRAEVFLINSALPFGNSTVNLA